MVNSTLTNSGAGFTVSDWKSFEKNTLRGFFSLTLPSGMILHGMTFHMQNDSRWVGLPAKEYTKTDKTRTWIPLVEFTTKEARIKFQQAAVAAVQRYLDEEGQR